MKMRGGVCCGIDIKIKVLVFRYLRGEENGRYKKMIEV